ncbi:MAG: DUF4430 domain-containing protein [Patescibacteria group bacterium]
MNKLSSIFLSALAAVPFFMPAPSMAADSVTAHLWIQTNEGDLYTGWVSVEDGCSVKDSDDVKHTFDSAVVLCALDAYAEQEGKTLDLVNSSYGLYLSGIGKHDQDVGQGWYWLYRVNNVSPAVGLDAYELADGDEIFLKLGAWPSAPVTVSVDTVDLLKGGDVTATVTAFDDATETFLPLDEAVVYVGKSDYKTYTTDKNGSVTFGVKSTGDYNIFATKTDYATSEVTHVRVRTENEIKELVDRTERKRLLTSALNWLGGQMDEEGVVDSIGITEWVVMAYARAGELAPKAMRQAVKSYDPDISSATDLERHILALEAVYANPHNQNGENYVQQLYNNHVHDGQIGDEDYLNDDIWGLIALLSAGQDVNSKELKDITRFILDHQLEDGSFSYSTSLDEGDADTTAAALRALKLAKKKESVVNLSVGISNAKMFLESVQRMDGGFAYDAATIDSNSATTAWVTLALSKPSSWKVNKRHPWTYLSWSAQGDGSFAWIVGLDGDSLTTAYVAEALAKSLE